MKKSGKLITLCVIVLIAAGIMVMLYPYFSPAELVVPEFDEVCIRSGRSRDEEISITEPAAVEEIALALQETDFVKSFRSYREAPPVSVEFVAFRRDGETLMSLWIVLSNWYRVDDYIVLTPPGGGARIAAYESGELVELLRSYTS